MKSSTALIKFNIVFLSMVVLLCVFTNVEVAQAEELDVQKEAATTETKVVEEVESVQNDEVEKDEGSAVDQTVGDTNSTQESENVVSESKSTTISPSANDAGSTSSSNGALENGSVYVISSSVNQHYVIDIAGGSKESGGNAQVYENNGSLAQSFKIVWISGDWYYLINVGSGLYLDVSGGSVECNANVQQYASNGSAAQKWKIVKNADGTYTLFAGTNEQLALDVAAGIAANGQNVQVYSKNDSNAQKWYFTKQSILSDAVKNGIAVSDGIYTIVTDLPSERVVDVSSASTSDGANVQIYDSNSSFAQKVKIISVGVNIYVIQFANSGKVMDVAGGSTESGANVQQYSSNATFAQYWYFTNAVQSGFYNIVSLLSGLVLDVAGAIDANGTNVQIYTLNDSIAQAFKLKSVALINDGTYVIQSAIVTPMVLDISGGSTSNGGNVQIYRSNGTAAQQFVIKHLGGGIYSIQNANSGLMLDVACGSTANSANVQQYAWNNTDAQKWFIDFVDGIFTFRSAVSNKYLDVSCGSRFSGGNVQQYGWNGSAAQRWILRDGNWKFFEGASASAMRFIEKAEEYQGWRYQWGGRSPQTSFDCAGLVMYCANQTLGKNYNLWYTNAESLLYNHCYQISASEAQAGDLVFYRGTYGNNVNYISHVVIYCGDGIYYGAGDPIGYEWVGGVRNIYGDPASVVYARMI